MPENYENESLSAAGLDAPVPTSETDKATGAPCFAAVGPLQATTAVIVDNDIVRLALAVGDEVVASLPLGPADAIALASDLLLSARRRMGRASTEESR